MIRSNRSHIIYRNPKRQSTCVSSSYNAYILHLAKIAFKIVGASAATLILQLIWIVLKTPRLPPPPLSGTDFVREGIVVKVGNDDENSDNHSEGDVLSDTNNDCNDGEKDFRLVLIGDSPVEGVGNAQHKHALGGETAHAFAKSLCPNKYSHVRYWSYGKCGLTVRGIQNEMVPLLHQVADDKSTIHAIVLLCGVNNVLDPLSTPASFYTEVYNLLNSIRSHLQLTCTPIIVLGLPDFSKLPFLPWPLSFALGLRGRKMQQMLETAVRDFQLKEKNGNYCEEQMKARTIIVNLPEVQGVLGSIGYHRHDSDVCNKTEDTSITQNDSLSRPLEMRICHPLLKYLGNRLHHSKLGSLGIEDFLCDDGFHPGGRYGTVYIGNLIAEAYKDRMAK